MKSFNISTEAERNLKWNLGDLLYHNTVSFSTKIPHNWHNDIFKPGILGLHKHEIL